MGGDEWESTAILDRTSHHDASRRAGVTEPHRNGTRKSGCLNGAPVLSSPDQKFHK